MDFLAKSANKAINNMIKNHFTTYHNTLNTGNFLRRYNNKKLPQNTTKKKTSVGDVIGGYASKKFIIKFKKKPRPNQTKIFKTKKNWSEVTKKP